MQVSQNRYFDRELSWLSFNHRVLQEAEKKSNPLMERLKFLAIYSANMDEFFRVRVSSLRTLAKLEKDTKQALLFDPKNILRKIHDETMRQQMLFGEIFRNDIVPELRKRNIYLTRSEELNEEQEAKVIEYFKKEIEEYTDPVIIETHQNPPFLKDGRLYLAVRMRSSMVATHAELQEVYGIVAIPTHKISRFFTFQEGHRYIVLFLGDVLRVGLKILFPTYEILGAYSIKMSRDAELHIDDEYEGDLVEKIREGLEKRKFGAPMRFLFDIRMPEDMLYYFKQKYQLSKMDVMPGGRYHSLNDFMGFPNPENRIPQYAPQSPIPHFELEGKKVVDVVRKQDVMLYFPFHSFDYVIRWLAESAVDKAVTAIKITLYRVASDSKVVEALINAAKNGKKVTAFVELKARFDEASNLHWANKMEEEGIEVLYSMPGLKVHTKLCTVTRLERGKLLHYSYLASGNMNEKTAKIYGDFGMITADRRITAETELVFQLLEKEEYQDDFEQLLISPHLMRHGFERLIDFEIEQVKKGKKAYIRAKMNSLEDWAMIDKLYAASRAGVKIDLIVRGICCLIPKMKGLSENIRVISIVGRYLEHARVFQFHHAGENIIYVSSADWMRRNLSKRVEMAFPILNEKIKAEVNEILNLQMQDNVNARLVNKHQDNTFVRPLKGEVFIDGQMGIYKILERKWAKK